MTRRLSVLATREEIELSTSFVFPPVPWRHDDWSAIDGNSYDADWQGEEDGFVSKSAHGHGESEAEAIADLLDQIEERA